jgi:hypothetical protein
VNCVRTFPLTTQADDCIDELTGDPINDYQSPKKHNLQHFVLTGYDTFKAYRFLIFFRQGFPFVLQSNK